MMVIAEVGTSWFPNKYPLRDAISAALDCGADLVKVQYFTNANRLAMRRGGTKGLEQWELKPKDLLALAEVLAEKHGRPVLGFSVFHPGDIQSLLDAQFSSRRMPFAFIKVATQEYGYAALAEAVSEFSASQGVPLMVSVPPDGCLTVGNYHSPLPITWLQCFPYYPALPGNYSWARQADMTQRLPGEHGVSDHTPDEALVRDWCRMFSEFLREPCSVAEKHFVYDEALRDKVPDGGPWSLSQADFKKYVAVAHGQ